MKKFLAAALLACLSSIGFCQATTAIRATKVLDNTGGLLGSGQLCLGASCFTVTGGAVAPGATVSNPTSATLTVKNAGGTLTYLTIPGVVASGYQFNFDTFVVPASSSITGLGTPHIACYPGATYTQTDSNQNVWNCKSINGVSTWSGLVVNNVVGPPGSPGPVGPAGAPGPIPLSAGLTLSGDSITHGVGASTFGTAYAYMLGADFGGTFTNNGVSGDQAADMTRNQIFPLDTPQDRNNPTYTIMIGANDANPNNTFANPTSTDKQTMYGNVLMAGATHLAIRTGLKVYAQSSAVTLSGTWAADTLVAGMGRKSSTIGSTLSFPITTTGGPIYLAYRIVDGNTGRFSVTIDGVNQGNLNAYGWNGATILTQNGSSDTVSAARYTVAAGAHTVVVSVVSSSGTVYPMWVGTPDPQSNTTGLGYPKVFIAGVLRQINDQNPTTTAAFDSVASSVAAQLASDGLKVTFVPVRLYMFSTPPEMYDYIHPSDLGHSEIKSAFEDSATKATTPAPSTATGSGMADFYSSPTINANAAQFGSFRYATGFGNYSISPPAAGNLFLNYDQGLGVFFGDGAAHSSTKIYTGESPDATLTGMSTLRYVRSTGNLSINPAGPGGLFLSYEQGAGYTTFGDGAGHASQGMYTAESPNNALGSEATLRYVHSSGNFSINPSITGGIFLGYDQGSGGTTFGNGAGGAVAKIDNAGHIYWGGGVVINSSSNVPQTAATAPTGTCTPNGYIAVVVNGVTLHLATCP